MPITARISTSSLEKGRNMMPLTLANIGEENMIKKVGGKPEVRKRLESLGFVAGGSVTVLNTIGGNVIVNVKETRVAISREMAQKIMI
jgi:ferrous iron transport protein A